MNIFIFLVNKDGERELVTPPLDGTILPGVTRDSVLELLRGFESIKVSERVITMHELEKALGENRVSEIFVSGTAAVINSVRLIGWGDKQLVIPLDPLNPDLEFGPLARWVLGELTSIQYGHKVFKDWSVVVS